MTKSMPARRPERGFTLIEMIVVVFLLAIAMLGLLAVFDASARINKSEQDVADAQGAVRYGIYQMTRAIRMAGAGPLYVTQAILNAPDPQLAGITVGSAGYDNVTGASVTDLSGTAVPVRDGTDMIEVRGVINSPLLALDASSGCSPCLGAEAVPVKTTVNMFPTGGVPLNAHLNDDPARPQFAAVDAYTQGVSAGNPMLVIVTSNDDVHGMCATINLLATPPIVPRYPQPRYNIGLLSGPTSLVTSQTLGTVNFADSVAVEFDSELPSGTGSPTDLSANRRGVGILDDLVYFIDNTDPTHPGLSQGTRRGNQFDIVRLADDVEDMQIAYGVDTDGNGAINRLVPTVAGTDTDLNVSTQVGGDEWRPNVVGETPYVTTDFLTLAQPCHAPVLHGVMISLVAKSKDPDPTYRSPNNHGLVVMNTPSTIKPPFPDTAQYPTLAGDPQFRRRVQTLKINLRNYAFE